MSGLAPTLVIVRVAYGKSVETVQQMMSIHFAEQASRETRQPTVDICSDPQYDDDASDTPVEELKPGTMVDEGRMV
ncbi:hypothetical protein AAF712_012680 [Marasmius tenuissimus]|uniref:Uncharacterized protein n=1 Tax=Marasmius tenuissimus TaxID=585030 RepID=A0ABR2ZJ92_9AGAR